MRIVVLLSDAFIFVGIPYRILNARMRAHRVASAMPPATWPLRRARSAALAASIRPSVHSAMTQVKRSIPAGT
jgi:hypothetical protein